MPYRTEWVDNEVALEHAGVVIYHTYKDDEEESGQLLTWFCLNAWDRAEEAFDAETLVDRVPSGYLFRDGQCDILTILREAIDAGLLTQEGIKD